MSHSACDFQFLRLAVLLFTSAPKQLPAWSLRSEGAQLVHVRHWAEDDKLQVLVAGVIDLANRPDLDDCSRILVPKEARGTAEQMIEAYAHLISVGCMCTGGGVNTSGMGSIPANRHNKGLNLSFIDGTWRRNGGMEFGERFR